jgi:UPF0755 protein
MKNVAANVLSVLIVLGLVVLVAVGVARREFSAPGPLQEEVTVLLPKGAGLGDTARLLKLSGAIGNETLFRLGARYRGEDRAIRYGEYRIPARASMEEILGMLVRGETVRHRVTVAEGLTSWQVVELLRQNEVLTGGIEEVPPEGSLAPETYVFERGQTRAELVRWMQEAQTRLLAEAWERRAPDLPLRNPEEVLILASIVEKETGVPEERGRVASVFLNRLRRGMRLQSDPTVVYGVTGGKEVLDRGLRRSEIERVTPYNTYQIDGLPPTPIANPGRASILAVVNPEETGFLYFVADGTGGHVFAETLAEHNRNVARWRKIEQERQN